MIKVKIICDGCNIIEGYEIPLENKSGDILPEGWTRVLYTPGDGSHLLCINCLVKVIHFIESIKDV